MLHPPSISTKWSLCTMLGTVVLVTALAVVRSEPHLPTPSTSQTKPKVVAHTTTVTPSTPILNISMPLQHVGISDAVRRHTTLTLPTPSAPTHGSQPTVSTLANQPPSPPKPADPPPQPLGPATIKLPESIKCSRGELIEIVAETNGKYVEWVLANAPSPAKLKPSDSGKWAVFASPVDGQFLVMAITATNDIPSKPAWCWVIVGNADPKPKPDPDPKPKPDPNPPPSPAPIPVDGLRVMFVYESSSLTKMPPAQQAVLSAKVMRDYLNDKCKGWKIYDKDDNLAFEPTLWQDAFKRPRTSLPWMLVSNGKTGWEGPLPATVQEAMALLKKFE